MTGSRVSRLGDEAKSGAPSMALGWFPSDGAYRASFNWTNRREIQVFGTGVPDGCREQTLIGVWIWMAYSTRHNSNRIYALAYPLQFKVDLYMTDRKSVV